MKIQSHFFVIQFYSQAVLVHSANYVNNVYNQVMGDFYPSTQRHYRKLIYYLYIILLHVSDIIKQRICCQLSNPSY
jgi:hypothetical protein